MQGLRKIAGFVMASFWPIVGVVLVVSLAGVLIFCLTFVTFVDKHELGFSFDRFSGKIERLERTGWVVLNPVRYSVHTIDLRPYQVTISANARILNAKLVRFDPAGLDTFVEWHGCGAADSTYSMLEILKCYAFDRADGRDCPFLVVVSEISPVQSVPTTSGASQ